MAIRTIDDSLLQGIAEAIQAKDGGGKMYDTEMRGRIQALNVTDKWELLNEVTLDADVSIIKIDISAYKNDYSAFLVAPQLTPSNYAEWFYFGGECKQGAYVKGMYSNHSLTRGAFEYPNYFGYYSADLHMLLPNNAEGKMNYNMPIADNQYLVLSLFVNSTTFLSGGSYKLYGKKAEDYLNVD